MMKVGKTAANDVSVGDRFRVGAWLIDRKLLQISDGGNVTSLEPRAMHVLVYLAQRAPDVVTIDELMDKVWTGTVVTTNAVTRVIAQLRRALHDDAKNPDYIDTISRTGYRLIAPVEPVSEGGSRTRRVWLVAAGVVAAGLVIAIGVTSGLWTGDRDEPRPGIAVLPFTNLSGDEESKYLSDGVAEELLDALARNPNLHVVARTSSFSFQGSDADLPTIADRLGVDYVVEGQLRPDGDRLSVSVRLIDAHSGIRKWTDAFEGSLREIVARSETTARNVAAAIGSEIPGNTGLARGAGTTDARAYDLYLRGRYLWRQRGGQPMGPAIDAFAEAVSLDPGFAEAWAALASAYLTYPQYAPEGAQTWELARPAAEKALALRPDLGEPYLVLGGLEKIRGNWTTADEMYRRALELEPQNPTASYWYSELLAQAGRHRASLPYLEHAIELNPVYLVPRGDLGLTYLHLGDYQRGRTLLEEAWTLGLRTPLCWFGVFIASLLTDDFTAAAAWMEHFNGPPESADLMRRFLAEFEHPTMDERARLTRAIDGAVERGMLPAEPGTWMLAQLDAGFALAALNSLSADKFIDPRPIWGPNNNVLHRTPGFEAFIEGLGLPMYWRNTEWPDYCRPNGETFACGSP
jgi:TolB-like protein/DNA-binding winged helix-turn-helix (wHTH) protein